MNKKKHAKYYLAMASFAVIFLITLVIVIATSYEDFQYNKYKGISERVKTIKSDVEYSGSVTEALDGFNVYIEKEFDAYWEYASIETAYVEGCLYARAIYDTDGEEQEYNRKCLQERIDKINDFLDHVDIPWMEEYAKTFVEVLESEI